LQTSAKLGAVEQRWQAQFAQFNFTITYRSGKLKRAADVLSRMPSSQDLKLDTTDLPTRFNFPERYVIVKLNCAN
jgi:hypothetical protein